MVEKLLVDDTRIRGMSHSGRLKFMRGGSTQEMQSQTRERRYPCSLTSYHFYKVPL